jgi:hypothetical protein
MDHVERALRKPLAVTGFLAIQAQIVEVHIRSRLLP